MEEQKWQDLSAIFLPIHPKGSKWRYNRAAARCRETQGWKIHVSATVLSATKIFERIAPYLAENEISFKGPCSLAELYKINSGLHYGYSQIGKFITVYSRSAQEARRLIRKLHSLTRGQECPTVPFDARYRTRSCVFYRYGSYEIQHAKTADGTELPAIRTPNGELIPDDRYGERNRPDWIEPLFASDDVVNSRAGLGKLGRYRVFQCVSQRGKGGVYKAVDFGSKPPQLCIVKEGRFCGETFWDHTDGRFLIEKELKVLQAISKVGVPAPKVIDFFKAGRNRYLVTELIDGLTLEQQLLKRTNRLSILRVIEYSLQLAVLVDKIHAAGWVWQDCKPSNIVVSGSTLFPIDFEGACATNAPDHRRWSTKLYYPGEGHGSDPILHDLFAMGALIYFLITGQLPDHSSPIPVTQLRANVPKRLITLIENLLGMQDGLSAASAAEELRRLANAARGERAHRRLPEVLRSVDRAAAYQKLDQP